MFVGNKVFHQDQYVSVGQSVTIKCHASNVSSPVFWDCSTHHKQSICIVYHGQCFGSYEKRCSVDNSNYDLTVHEVVLDDTREYWCIENEGYGNKHVTKLYVTGMVQLSFLDIESFCNIVVLAIFKLQ